MQEVYETSIVGLMAAGSPTLPLDLRSTDALAASVDDEWARRGKHFQDKGVAEVLGLWRRSYQTNTEGR